MECPVMSFEMGLCVWCDFGQPVSWCLGQCCWRICMVCLALKHTGFLGGGWIQCRYGDFWTVSYYLMFHAVRSFLVFWGLGLSLLPLDFSFILPVVPRLLQLYSTDNKTSRLTVKRFSPVRDTQRGSQSYMKKRRGRREIEMSRRRKKGAEEVRDRSTQLSVPKVFSTVQTEIHRIGLGREGERRK